MQSIRIREHQFKNNNGIGLGNQRYRYRYKKNEKIKRKKCLKRRSRTDFSFHWLNDHFTFYYYVEFYLYVIQTKARLRQKIFGPERIRNPALTCPIKSFNHSHNLVCVDFLRVLHIFYLARTISNQIFSDGSFHMCCHSRRKISINIWPSSRCEWAWWSGLAASGGLGPSPAETKTTRLGTHNIAAAAAR